MKTIKFLVVLMMAIVICPSNVMAQKKKSKKQTTTVQKDSVAILRDLANSGNADAQNTLGKWYYTGEKVKKDSVVALKYWALAAKQNHKEAIGNMAMCYQLGRGIKADSTMAVKLYEKAIELGNTAVLQQHIDLADKKNNLFSSVLLHEMYKEGKGVARDQKKAQHYLQKAAEGGDTECQKSLAMYFLNSKNTTESAKWFKKVADKGNLTGIYYYGYQLYKGMGVKQDKATGIDYLQKAANRGMIAGNRMLGSAYYEGNGVEQNYKVAVEHLKKAAVAKFPDSQLLLAKCYMNGQGVTQDYDQAVQWMAEVFCQNSKQAEEVRQMIANEADANFRNYIDGLKNCYVDHNFTAAISLFKKVEKAGNMEGLTMQGVCLADENNAKANAKKAVKTLEKAAEKSAAAKYHLAQMYQDGKGVEKDSKMANELILKAADGGNGYAMAKAGDMYFEGKGVAQDYVKAVEYYLQAEALSKLNNTSARNLAKCYSMGISNLPDKDKSKERIEALEKIQSQDKQLEMLKKL